MDKDKIGQIQEITYYRVIKPPTLRQYLYRRAVSNVMATVKGEVGVGTDIDSGKPAPISAIKAKEMLKGTRAEDLMKLHPGWVEDYRREYGQPNLPHS